MWNHTVGVHECMYFDWTSHENGAVIQSPEFHPVRRRNSQPPGHAALLIRVMQWEQDQAPFNLSPSWFNRVVSHFFFLFFFLCPRCIQSTGGDFPRRGERVGHIIYVFRQRGVTVALRCRMGKYSAQLSEESLQQCRSVARPLVYVYTARLGVARQAPAEVERKSSGFTAGAKLHTSHDWSSGKKVVMIAHTAGATERLWPAEEEQQFIATGGGGGWTGVWHRSVFLWFHIQKSEIGEFEAIRRRRVYLLGPTKQ